MIYGQEQIIILENTYIGRSSLLQSFLGYKITIGKNCKIGPFLSVWTYSSDVDSDFNDFKGITPKIGSVVIKDAV